MSYLISCLWRDSCFYCNKCPQNPLKIKVFFKLPVIFCIFLKTRNIFYYLCEFQKKIHGRILRITLKNDVRILLQSFSIDCFGPTRNVALQVIKTYPTLRFLFLTNPRVTEVKFTFTVKHFMCVPWFIIFSTLRFACGQIPESVNIPYNQAFLEEGGLAPSAAANTVISFKGRVIVVVGNRNNYPAKVRKRVTSMYSVVYHLSSFVTFRNTTQLTQFIIQSACVLLVLTNHSSLRSSTPVFVWREKHISNENLLDTFIWF